MDVKENVGRKVIGTYMQILQNYILQKFLDKFINELKNYNDYMKYLGTKELNIPFIISSLWQSFDKNTYKYEEFISDLEKWSDYQISIDESTNDYDGIIDVTVVLVDVNNSEYLDIVYSNYNYRFEFSYDERLFGYCECTPDMPDYREDKHCSGHGCDASFCQFILYKVLHITKDTWHGDEHDYWDFEDEFYASDKELADKKAVEEKTRMINELKRRIEAESKKLAELEGE